MVNLDKAKKRKYSKNDLRFMASMSEAILAKTPTASRKIIYVVVIAAAFLIGWSAFTQIDEIARGQGKIIPSGKNQIIQNLEGGIVEEILVHQGQTVKKGEIILKINNKNFTSSYGESQIKEAELSMKKARLTYEAEAEDFSEYDFNRSDKLLSKFYDVEFEFFKANNAKLRESIGILQEQLKQKESELVELHNQIAKSKEAYALAQKEISIIAPLNKKGLVSDIEMLNQQKALNQAKADLRAAELSLPRVQSTIDEAKQKISETELGFLNQAKKELTEVTGDLARLKETQTNLVDKVDRTNVVAPTDGVVSKLMVNTIGGVIKPSMDIAEIVPLDDKLIAEVKVKPSDVAFIRDGLDAMVKVTAYDFSIYGGLKGKVTQISADTENNEKTGESYYLVRIETEKNHLGNDKKPLYIKVGMIVSADIITGKKSILDYLLKPILKAKQNALTER